MFVKHWLWITLVLLVTGSGIARAQPAISTTPATSHDFGAVRFNNAAPVHAKTLTLSVANTGEDEDLVITSIVAVGGNTGDFTVNPTTATIGAGKSQDFTVTFDPSDAGSRSTTLQIASNDPDTPTKSIALSGVGSTAVISVSDHAFGIVPHGTTSNGSITITNIGSGTKGTLSVTQAEFTSNGGNWFKFNAAGCAGSTTTCALALGVDTTGSLPVQCNPPSGASGSQTAFVKFTSDSDTSPMADDVAMLTCTSGRADIEVMATPLMFGDQLINTTSPPQTVTVKNNGNIPLVYSVALGGTNPGQFQATVPGGCTSNCMLAAGASENVSVAFRPTSTGAKSATLTITAQNDPDSPTAFNVSLSGTGVAPVSAPSATMLAFGDIDVGDTSTAQTLTVTNTGSYPLTITAAHLSAGASDYAVSGTTTGTGLSIMVPPSQSVSWMIACKPSAMNSRPGTFRITSNHNGAAGTNQDIALTCNGRQGVLEIQPSSYDFGGVRENETRMQTFALRNTGNTAVNNITVAFSGTGTGYTVMPTTIASIAAGSQVTVTATFAPQSGNDGGMYVATYTGSWGNAKTTSAVLTLNGDGLSTGFDTNPSGTTPLAFGSIRFDETKVMTVDVINTAGTALQIRGYEITPGTAQTGEFTVVRCLKGTTPITCPTMAAPYNSSGVNDTIKLEVRFDPNDRVAMMTATLTIMSDLPTNPNRSVQLVGSSTTAMVSVNPSSLMLDFGPTDLQATPVTQTRTLTITNTGTAPLDFSTVQKSGDRYTFSNTPAPFQLAPSATYSIEVSYTPTIEKPSNQPDTGQIVIGGLAGVLGGPSALTINLSGYGVDRHIAVAPAPTFPDTYKNPGADAPVMPVTVTNTGDAPLAITAVMLTNDPIWTLVNPEPVTVPGKGSHDFNVRFAPVMAGKAPTGQLVITNDDDGRPMVEVELNGNGIARNTAIGPGVIDLGYVGIGMTVKLSAIAKTEVLSITNADTVTFPITKVEVMGGDDAFVVTTLDGNELDPANPMPLPPNTSQAFDVEFTPNREGDFEAMAIVYLGEDPQPAVTLQGRGLYVDTGGGGGCSTGRGSGFAMIVVVLALVLGRRRTAIAKRGAVATLGTLGMIVGVRPALAEQTRNVSLPLFDPTPTASREATFQLQGASVAEPGSLGVFALVSYASKPLVLRTAQNDAAAVDSRTTFELGLAYAFGSFEVGLHMPIYVQSGDALPTPEQRREMFGVEPAGTAWGDLTLHGKYQVAAHGGVAFGLAAAVTAPIAKDDQFAGNDLPTGRGLFLLSLARGPLTATLNAGGVVRQKAQVGSAIQRSGAIFGGGLSLRVLDQMWLAGEVYGELMPGGQTAKPAAGEAMGAAELGKPIEGLFGMRYQMSRTTGLGLAVGRGITDDMGSPALRGVVSITYTPSAQELKPLRPPRPPEPEKDADGDGISDKLDHCPNEPEDKDLFDDADGCPDVDNDRDGIADVADKCPLDAEDKDGFQDDDGCPDKDNDGDGIPDEMDKCPLQAEDKDGFQDTDGCPDPDNDGDGLLDSVDKCPLEPETINGNNDDDGCPDKGDALVVVSPDRLETLEAIQFVGNTARIAKSSHNVLGQIGATLRANPEILRVRVTVHVQRSRDTAADKRLSEQRAKAIREWLIEWGVDPLRLQVAGFGSTKPLVDPQSRGAAMINNRVELIVLERK